MHRLQDLVRLHRLGEKARAAARQLKMGPNQTRALRDALKTAALLDGSPEELPETDVLRAAIDAHIRRKTPVHEASSIEIWTDTIETMLEDELTPKAIYDRLRLEHGPDSEGERKFDGSYWAVKRTWRLGGQKLWVRGTRRSIEIYDADERRVATHSRGKPGSRNTIDQHLPEGRRDLRHRSRSYWEERASKMGPEVGSFVKEVFDSDDVLYQLRAVQAIVMYLEKFPLERARAACARASFFGSFSYRAIKSILNQALDLEPIPTAVTPATAGNFRFARNIAELLAAKLEVSHEPH